jgi:tetratricopeptide (TPR) repeat protein
VADDTPIRPDIVISFLGGEGDSKSSAPADVTFEESFQILSSQVESGVPCCVLVGAGISLASGLPSGSEFKKLIFDQMPTMEAGPRDMWSNAAAADHTFQTRFSRVAPEVILSVFAESGQAHFGALLRAFASHVPNSSHRILMEFHSRGLWSCVATTNFDLLLEQSLPAKTITGFTPGDTVYSPSKNVLKLHGSCQQSASAVMTLFDRFRGWENAALKAFSKALSDRSLFVFGYSGFDFDVLLSIRDSTVKKIYWLCQPGIGFSFPELPDVIGRERMFRLEGDIHDFFARAAKHFGTPQFVPATVQPEVSRAFVNSIESWAKHIDLATWLEVVGGVMFEMLNFRASIAACECALSTLTLREDASVIEVKARLMSRIGDAHLQMGEYNKANDVRSAAVNLLLEHDREDLIALSSPQSVHIFEKLRNYDGVKQALEMLLPIFLDRRVSSAENIKEYLELLLAFGSQCARQHDQQGAETTFRHARREAETFALVTLFIDATFRLCQILMWREDMNALTEARDLCLEIYAVSGLWGSIASKARVARMLSSIFMKLGDPRKAGKWLGRAHNYSQRHDYPQDFGRWQESRVLSD